MLATSHADRAAVVAALLWLLPAVAGAQYLERPTFSVSDRLASTIDAAAAPDGSLMVLYNDADQGKYVFSRRYSAAFTSPGEISHDAQWADHLAISVAATGGFVGAWRQPVFTSASSFLPGLYSRRFDEQAEMSVRKSG